MKLLILFDNSYPEGMAMANRLKLYAKALVSVDVHVTILAGKSNTDPQYKQKEFEGHYYYNIKSFHSLKRIPILNKLFYWINKLPLYSHLFKNICKYDVVWSIGYSWFSILIFSIICKINRKKIIIELNELPHSIIASRLQSNFTNGIKRSLLFHVSYPRIDGFVVISKKLELLATNYKNKKAKILKIPILIDTSQFKKEENLVSSRFTSPYIFHAGTLTEEKDGILQVFEAFAQVASKQYPQLKFILSNKITLPNVINKINKIIFDYNVNENIIFNNHIKQEVLDLHLKSCSLVIINKPQNHRNEYNFSTKLGECMNYGIPIITTPVGEAMEYLKDRENAHIVNSTDVNEITKRIIEILENPSNAIKLGNSARITAISEFDYRLYSMKLRNFLENL